MVQDYIHSIIRNYEEDLQKVKQYGHALQYVKEQTPEICLASVKKTGIALRFVKQQTPELCWEAVKETGYALQFVKDPILLYKQIKLHFTRFSH